MESKTNAFLNWLSMKMTLKVWKVVVRGIRRIGYGKLCPGIIILEGFFIRNPYFVGLQPVSGSRSVGMIENAGVLRTGSATSGKWREEDRASSFSLPDFARRPRAF